ncbi:hypothetical protein LEP1GSC043_3853 [Leptospira weilii str. Ecochallenge]|uniref:Uncharacterized protein n=1 Tax=Leptospira weilii str. Ecochallenge TaxID=1049986 RepID=N1U8Q8_9LEPT|nr:hypothetical protein LEP1GSC043_3853 [Leptospira weilii str. Ecochallenge]
MDALLGTGFRFPLKSPLDIVISKIKENKQKTRKVVLSSVSMRSPVLTKIFHFLLELMR